MAEAARRAPGLSRPTWILAHRQTAGRGRRGRNWSMPPGNFAATFVFRPGGSPADAALRSFVTANALYDALSHLVPSSLLALKWPNDVLLSGKKVAGILLETSSHGPQVQSLSIGIGVNLVHTPQVPDASFMPVSLLAAGARKVSPTEFLDLLEPAMSHEEARFAQGGFDAARTLWLSRAARLGDTITARTSHGETTGIFETVDETGQLVLQTAQGRVTIPAADVYF